MHLKRTLTRKTCGPIHLLKMHNALITSCATYGKDTADLVVLIAIWSHLQEYNIVRVQKEGTVMGFTFCCFGEFQGSLKIVHNKSMEQFYPSSEYMPSSTLRNPTAFYCEDVIQSSINYVYW